MTWKRLTLICVLSVAALPLWVASTLLAHYALTVEWDWPTAEEIQMSRAQQYTNHIIPVTVDGVYCLVLDYDGGVAMQCDWGNQRLSR